VKVIWVFPKGLSLAKRLGCAVGHPLKDFKKRGLIQPLFSFAGSCQKMAYSVAALSTANHGLSIKWSFANSSSKFETG